MSQIGDRSSASPRPPGQERRATLGALGSLPAHAPAQRPLSGHAAAPHQLPPHLQVPQPAQLQLFGGFCGLALYRAVFVFRIHTARLWIHLKIVAAVPSTLTRTSLLVGIKDEKALYNCKTYFLIGFIAYSEAGATGRPRGPAARQHAVPRRHSARARARCCCCARPRPSLPQHHGPLAAGLGQTEANAAPV